MSVFGDTNRIGTNVSALQAQQALNRVNMQIQDTQLQLSTGKRINRAGDDASGFAIANKIGSRITGMSQAMNNVADARSVLDLAEGGISAISDVLSQINAKVVQGATGTLGEVERGFIKDQITALVGEIDEIVASTTYQDLELLNGDGTGAGTFDITFQTGEGQANTLDVSITAVSATSLLGADFATDLDAADQTTFNTALGLVSTAVDTLSEIFNEVGVVQTQLSAREENLSQSIIANSAAKSRIEDADFAKVQSESIRLQILQQTTTNAFTIANTSPQAVLGFLR
jgi:flagellin